MIRPCALDEVVSSLLKSPKLFLACVFLLILVAPNFLVSANANPDSVKIVSITPTAKDLETKTPPFALEISIVFSFDISDSERGIKACIGNVDPAKAPFFGWCGGGGLFEDPQWSGKTLLAGTVNVFTPGFAGTVAPSQAKWPLEGAISVPANAREIRIAIYIIRLGETTAWDKLDITFGTATAEPLLVITMKTEGGYGDRPTSTYEQGEAVTITGQILIDGKPARSDPAKALEVVVKVPGDAREAIFDVRKKLDSAGRFSIMPLAGWNIGSYEVRLRGTVLRADKDEQLKVTSDVTRFNVKTAELVTDMRAGGRLDEMIRLFKATIPRGPVHFAPPELSLKDLESIAEPLYGAYHNIALDGTKADPEGHFACGGYRDQTLAFMDGLRFDPSPQKRALLKGLDHGPIARGTIWMLTFHVAVVLYPIGTDWSSFYPPPFTGQFPVVFDPWPKQRPDVYSVTEFTAGWGFVRVDRSAWTNEADSILTGYPMTGGSIYASPEFDPLPRRVHKGLPYEYDKISEPVTRIRDPSISNPIITGVYPHWLRPHIKAYNAWAQTKERIGFALND